MIRKILAASVATVALGLAGPALAGPGHAGGGMGGRANAGVMGGPSQSGIDARMNSQGPANASATGIANASPNSVLNGTTSTNVRGSNSQGLMHASPNGIANANSNSVLARGAVSSGTLPGLTTGLTVQNSSGTSIGTVSRVVTGSDGSVRMVIVQSPTGQTFRVAPNTLSISGNTVTTTSTIGG